MSDVRFTYSAVNYDFMLAEDDNGKRWNVEPIFRPAPSLMKNKITMTLKIAADIRYEDDSLHDDNAISATLTNLRTLTDGNTITLTGFDDATYYVTFDPNPVNIRSVLDESGRVVEYDIDVICWDLYQ